MSKIGWLDATNGVSGDMFLGALVDAGVSLETMTAALEPMGLPITLRAERVDRAGMAATKVSVGLPDGDHDHHHRRWRDIRRLLEVVDDPVRGLANRVFGALADAEAHVHGIPAEEVHFHEVGALDAIADIVASSAGLHALGLDRLVVSPLALGGGTARTAHGSIPVPVPAVLALASAAQAPAFGGPVEFELATPTGVAIATAFATDYGPMPPMTPHVVGVGAGDRNPDDRPNALRLIVGEPAGFTHEAPTSTARVLEANVDDMDPRMWPGVLSVLLAAGAGDAWLIPISMKKGRPAHTLCAIVSHDRASEVRDAIFANTTTIGIRESTVAKHALRREFRSVSVDGQRVSVKLGILPDGRVVNAMPEWEDVARTASELRLPVKSVLSQALGLASEFITP